MNENDALVALIVATAAVKITSVVLSHRRAQRKAADEKASKS